MKKLFCDCKTDEEKSNFFLSGRAIETGVAAPAISNDVAMAYHRCVELKKERDALRTKVEAMERQEPVGEVVLMDYGYTAGRIYIDKRLSVGAPLYSSPGAQAQPAPSFADAYQGAMEEVAIWKKRALEAEELNRRFVAEINGPVYMGEPVQPTPSVPNTVRKIIRGHRWDGEKLHHVPTLEIEFEPVPANSPNDAKGWQDRDRLAVMLAAAPEAKPCP